MVVPFGDKNYYAVRPQIAIPEPSRSADERALDLDGFFALHPALASLKSIYDERHLAIVHAVGSPANTRSHFDAQDYMESGTPGTKSAPDGWLNRYMQANSQSTASPFRGVALSANVPRSLMGHAPAIAMAHVAGFGIRGGPATAQIEEIFAKMYPDTFEAVKMLRAANPEQYSPENGAAVSPVSIRSDHASDLSAGESGCRSRNRFRRRWRLGYAREPGRRTRTAFHSPERIRRWPCSALSRSRRSHAERGCSNYDGIWPRDSSERLGRHGSRPCELHVCIRRASPGRKGLRPLARSCSRTAFRRPGSRCHDGFPRCIFGDSREAHASARGIQDFSGLQTGGFPPAALKFGDRRINHLIRFSGTWSN